MDITSLLIVSLILAFAAWVVVDVVRLAGHMLRAILARPCRDVWPVQSVSVLCAPRIDLLGAPVPSWW